MARAARKVSFAELAANLEEVFDRIVSEDETVVVEKGGRELAILRPIGASKPRRGKKGGRLPESDEVARSRDAILKAAGSWRNVDVEAFKADLYERRRSSSRPPVRL